MSPGRVMCGADQLETDARAVLRNRRVALVTAAPQVNARNEPVVEVVSRVAGRQLVALWSLQHGFFSDRQDNMVFSESFTHPRLKIPVRSLYGKQLLPESDWLEDVDLLLVDVFDVGTRVYTFLNHLVMVMRHLSGSGISIGILDRPNPLGGQVLEGPVADPAWFSIVAQLPVAMRHGLTAAEYLTMGRDHYRLNLELEVVKVRGWKRGDEFSGTWTYPSPNMPAFATARLYPGAVMLEGTNLSEGRGTTRPFELAGAPWLDACGLARDLRKLDIHGMDYLPLGFRPGFGKFAAEFCNGLLMLPRPEWDGRSFCLYYDLIRLTRNRHPDHFTWQQPPYEFEYRRFPMDMICGGSLVREWIEADRPFREVEPEIKNALDAYRESTAPYLLYE
ncbi:MAG TPA: DUF1343 domain-containing protein [Candidatus Aminicenantes bacterium]|nr:DUF1343 domain-containing protein [Candidatus Aminicenantes bacterium]